MNEPALLVHWEDSVGELLDRTQKFPKAVRFTFAARIDNRALDIAEALCRARWASPAEKSRILSGVDADLAVLRTLLRLAFARRFLDRSAMELLSTRLDEAGRMVGGWRRSLVAP